MTPDARVCLQKTWPLIERLVIEIGLIVTLIKPLARAEHLEMLRLVRLAEGLMRRWLVLSACARPLPEPRPGRAGGGFSGIDMGMPSGLSLPLFRLADPAPKSKAAPGADRPAEPFRILALQDAPPVPVPAPVQVPIQVPDAPVCISADSLPSFPTPFPTPWRADLRLWERANALLGAMREPDKHIARMRRFLAKSLSGLGPFPLRLARPWGQSAKEKRARPEAYAALKDLRVFTRDALIAQAAPG